MTHQAPRTSVGVQFGDLIRLVQGSCMPKQSVLAVWQPWNCCEIWEVSKLNRNWRIHISPAMFEVCNVIILALAAFRSRETNYITQQGGAEYQMAFDLAVGQNPWAVENPAFDPDSIHNHSYWLYHIIYHVVGGLEHFLFFHILGMSSSQLTFISFRGVETTNQ